jgi:FtsZ-interacting cell division protein ZipA
MLGASPAARTLKEILVLIGAMLLVAIAVMIWAVAFRKKRKRTRLYHRHHRSSTESAASENSGKRSQGSRRRREGRERPRNPTLAETGGLPPARLPPTPPRDIPY